MPIEVSTGFVPITELVPVLRDLGERAMALEEAQAIAAGERVSCRKGCAACCRMLVPVSAPEALALGELIETLPEERRRATLRRVDEVRRRLEQAGLWAPLTEIADTDRQFSDEEMEPINRAYFALRMPCPFLESEVCSIYEGRPAACRELLVTSPSELCEDPVANPVRPLPVPLRMSTVLGLLWSELNGGPIRFIPLPVALAWATRHAEARGLVWRGSALLEQALDNVWRFVSRIFRERGIAPPEAVDG
jgi:Fe-S-cluster containining protein